MARTRRVFIVGGAALAVVFIYLAGVTVGVFPFPSFRTREHVEPSKSKHDLLADDKLEDKTPPFDPALVDPRPVGDAPGNMWELNASAAVIGLDVPDIRDADEGHLFRLYPSYAAAAEALRRRGCALLPSINMLDGKAKQFDDGLYAELDSAMTFGKMRAFHDTSAMLKGILGNLDPSGEAYAWVWGGLEVGVDGFAKAVHTRRPDGAARFVTEFEESEVESKPIGFYTWSEDLERTFRMVRYFQRGWPARDGVPDEIARVLSAHPSLMEQYARLLDFHAHLTNPFDALSFADLAAPESAGGPLGEIAEARGLGKASVHLLPYSTSRETVLFERLFGARGLPEGADLMMEFVRAIRDGRVDLAPTESSGWYDYQVHALETFLLPERGKESAKLLLTKKYKERMLEAFKALVTKRRETHVRQLAAGRDAGCAPPTVRIAPRLRVEPNPAYFLRTARAYAFLQTYLESAVPGDVMKGLTGRKQGGERGMPLIDELEHVRSLFYGFHLVSCEDIGMRPDILEGELDDGTACYELATEWLARWPDDADLAVDTRVSVAVFVSLARDVTKLWCTLGVRGAKLKAWYARPPKWRPADKAEDASAAAEWVEVGSWQTSPAECVILVDEFAEVELKGLRVLTRGELRRVCDEQGTKEKIVEALSR